MTRKYYFWPLASLFALRITIGQVLPGRYIVELKSEPAAAVAARSGKREAMAVRRTAVRTEQRNLRTAIERTDTQVVDSVDTVANALIVRMPANRAAELASMPGVARVYQEKLYKLALDRAVRLQKVMDAWAQIGGMGKAGAGIKIGIIDTGIDVTHPGFQDSSLAALDGFPKVNKATDTQYTNNKIIVARNYDTTRLSTANDVKGHGTAVAMISAGVTNAGPLATITGIAPKAYLGNYKVFPDSSDGAPTGEILKALDDAVADGMDVVNLSLGSQPADRPSGDGLVQAVETATAAGVLVVIAAGNEGPDLHSIASPGTAPDAITVGNAYNDRVFASRVVLDGAQAYESFPGSGANSLSAITGPLVDVSTLDKDGLACASLPAGSLTGKIVLILRGTCTFEAKLSDAQNAGALGALVYTNSAQPDAIPMAVGQASLPASMVSYADGTDIKTRLAKNPGLTLSLNFDQSPFPVNPARIDDSSSRGPSADNSVKPDLLGVGSPIYTAWTTANGSTGGGYIVASGTSLSAPMVTGAAALLKAARPGLTPGQYRSLLINSAGTFSTDSINPASVEFGGAGLLDMSAALRSTVAAYPTSLGFGIGGATENGTQTVRLTNVGTSADTLSISSSRIGDGPDPSISDSSVQLGPGQSKDVVVSFQGSNLTAGQYQGFVVVRSTTSDVQTKLPYWYGVGSGVAGSITVFDPPTTGRRASVQTIQFRPVDAVGIPTTLDPVVTVVSGGGKVLGTNSADATTPGVYETQVQLGTARIDNVFQIQVGAASVTFTITAR